MSYTWSLTARALVWGADHTTLTGGHCCTLNKVKCSDSNSNFIWRWPKLLVGLNPLCVCRFGKKYYLSKFLNSLLCSMRFTWVSPPEIPGFCIHEEFDNNTSDSECCPTKHLPCYLYYLCPGDRSSTGKLEPGLQDTGGDTVMPILQLDSSIQGM